MIYTFGGVPVDLGARVHIMGILNVTPDSFSDGGAHATTASAVRHGMAMAEDGADFIDVGGESTRPGASPVAPEEEIRRVVPVVERLRARGFALPISVDTSKAEVARAALAAGADLVNDVRALSDPELARAVAEAGVPVVLMHMRGTPADMATRAIYADVAAEVAEELAASLARAEAAGVSRERVLLDPGIGFAKAAEHSVEVLARLDVLRALGRPLVVGPSRKSFIGKITGAAAAERLPGTLAAVTAAVLAGAEILRVHDVAEARQAALVAAAIRDAARPAAPG